MPAHPLDRALQDHRQPGLDASQLLRPEAPRDPGRCRRGNRRQRRQQRSRLIATLPVQGDQPVPTEQLTLRQRREDLTTGHAAITLLDQADPGIQRAEDIEALDQLRDRHDAAAAGQRHVCLAEPDLLSAPPAPTYDNHREGAFPAEMIKT